MKQQDERTRFVNWILLCCLQVSLDSTILISAFAGFNLWWIGLHFSLTSLNVMQAPWLPCRINLCGRTIRALCEFLIEFLLSMEWSVRMLVKFSAFMTERWRLNRLFFDISVYARMLLL